MSKTAREIIKEQIVGPLPGWQIDNAEAEAIIEELNAAGFVIVPKELSDDVKLAGARMIAEQLHHQNNAWDRILIGDDDRKDDYRNAAKYAYRAMIAAASQDPKP